MNRRGLFIAGWSLSVVTAAAVLERWTPRVPWVLAAMASEPAHVAAHVVLYGVLSLALAPFAVSRRRAVATAMVFLGVCCAQEGVQVQRRHRCPNQEEAFDLTVDVTGASLALALQAVVP